MNKQDLSEKLKAAYCDEMPNLLPRIEQSCSQTGQTGKPVQLPRRPSVLRRAAALAACLALFIAGFASGHFLQPPATPNITPTEGQPPATQPPAVQTVVYMDVNPSVELSFDAQNRVVSCKAGNEDAQIVLKNLKLEGVERNTALAAVMGSMYMNGYLKADSNAVLISVDSAEGAENTETVLMEITNEINEVFSTSDMTCSIIAQSVECCQELQQRAEGYGVSVGKMYLVDKLIEAVDFLEPADAEGLTQLSVCELNLMYISYADENKDLFGDDVVTGILKGFWSIEDVMEVLLDKIDQFGILESRESITDYALVGDQWRVVYEVSIRFKYSQNYYFFRYDCRTGELLESDFEFGNIWQYKTE